MINDGDTIISNSWAYCENQTNSRCNSMTICF